ncbi:MAG TPA: choice-of-anchor tandem repeat GloVer-containing protein, partial [Candidatus Cybelea sp.]
MLYRFKGGSNGYRPVADLIGWNGTLYGTTEQGAHASCYDGCGTVFRISPDGAYHVIHHFLGYPHDGAYPEAGFILVKGKLYGTTFGGGVLERPDYRLGGFGPGTVYSIDTSGKESVIYTFAQYEADGSRPLAALTEYRGALYGTTVDGGVPNACYGSSSPCGTVFKTTLSGKEKVLYEFKGRYDPKDGSTPFAGLTLVGNKLYGTTRYGGTGGVGVVFSITSSGKESILHTF